MDNPLVIDLSLDDHSVVFVLGLESCRPLSANARSLPVY